MLINFYNIKIIFKKELFKLFSILKSIVINSLIWVFVVAFSLILSDTIDKNNLIISRKLKLIGILSSALILEVNYTAYIVNSWSKEYIYGLLNLKISKLDIIISQILTSMSKGIIIFTTSFSVMKILSLLMIYFNIFHLNLNSQVNFIFLFIIILLSLCFSSTIGIAIGLNTNKREDLRIFAGRFITPLWLLAGLTCRPLLPESTLKNFLIFNPFNCIIESLMFAFNYDMSIFLKNKIFYLYLFPLILICLILLFLKINIMSFDKKYNIN